MQWQNPNGSLTKGVVIEDGAGNKLGTSTNPLNTFLAPRGYAMVWSGWDQAAGTDNSNFNTTITLPVAKNSDGTSITGPAYEYIVLGAGGMNVQRKSGDYLHETGVKLAWNAGFGIDFNERWGLLTRYHSITSEGRNLGAVTAGLTYRF